MIERLRRALAPDYEIEREIAGGGMGLVFAARQIRLNRTVAIKILRPELATAIATERFLDEGRLLARLDHPAIVPVYDAGEADGLFYYVMKFVDGETLAERLKRGPLAPGELRDLARDLLAALATAHARGVVHRDVKPANIFLREGRALLGDFGIARWRERSDGGLTTPGQMVGTPRYMSPEQRDGAAATPETDVYQAALVLWEAASGVRWPAFQAPGQADWRRIPAALAGPLRRALAVEPGVRFKDAGAFRAAIDAGYRSRPGARRLVTGTLVVVAGLLAWWVLRPPPPSASMPAGLRIAVPPFTLEGQAGDRALGDSLSRRIAATLSDYPDFGVLTGAGRGDSAAVTIRGTARLTNGKLLLSAQGTAAGRASAEPVLRAPEGPESDWRELADSLSLRVVRWIFDGPLSDDPWLPARAIPAVASPGWAPWFKAEQHFSLARWDEAFGGYQDAVRADSGCLLCSYRLIDVARWIGQPQDSAWIRRAVAGIDSFPAHYRPLVRAVALPLPARLDTLQLAATTNDNFFLARFEYGDELFHRGPLYGRRRADAESEFSATTQYRPRFGPAWEHLLWLRLSEGDSVSAAAALAHLDGLPGAPTGFTARLRALLHLGFAWRYLPAETARTLTLAALATPGVAGSREVTAGARLLMTTDTPRGAVELGGMLAASGASDAMRNGLLGQLVGYAALGRLDSMRMTGERLARLSSDGSLPLLALELEAMLRAFDPDPAMARAPGLMAELTASLGPGAASEGLRRRAAFSSGILAARAGDAAHVDAARRVLTGDPAARPLLALIDAAALLAHGDSTRALAALPALPELDRQLPSPDPFADLASHFLRADALSARDPERARSTLRWHEHLQTIGHLADDAEPGEMAWAAGTLARWKRIPLLAGVRSDEQCRLLAAVARLWGDGETPYRARADSARRAAAAHSCSVR